MFGGLDRIREREFGQGRERAEPWGRKSRMKQTTGR